VISNGCFLNMLALFVPSKLLADEATEGLIDPMMRERSPFAYLDNR
jgi:hypothetical protein